MKLDKVIQSIGMVSVFFFLSGCDSSKLFNCDKELKSTSISSDGKYKAVVLSVQCGATTSDATWVLLTQGDREFDFDKDDVAVFEGNKVHLSWKQDVLEVAYYEAKPFKMEPSRKGMSIEYVNRKL